MVLFFRNSYKLYGWMYGDGTPPACNAVHSTAGKSSRHAFGHAHSEAPRGKSRGIFAEPCEAKNVIPPCGKPQDFLAKKGKPSAAGRGGYAG
jgi:hypothetical protein